MQRINDYTTFKLVEVIQFIQCERERSHWPMKRLAYYSGISQSAITKGFTLKNELSFRNLVALLDTLGYELQIIPKRAGQK